MLEDFLRENQWDFWIRLSFLNGVDEAGATQLQRKYEHFVQSKLFGARYFKYTNKNGFVYKGVRHNGTYNDHPHFHCLVSISEDKRDLFPEVSKNSWKRLKSARGSYCKAIDEDDIKEITNYSEHEKHKQTFQIVSNLF